MKIRVKIIVKGFVQGVGYRFYCSRKAKEYKITGHAKNLINGDVEVDAFGEKNLIPDFVKELKIGPMNASVTSVTVEDLPFENEPHDFKTY